MTEIGLVLATALAAIACKPVVVDPDDMTPPHITVMLPLAEASDVDARYTDDGTDVELELDPSRHFVFTPRRDTQALILWLRADDEESGISRLSATLELTFDCHAVVGGVEAVKPTSAVFYDVAGEHVGAGEETLGTTIVGFAVDLEALWNRGNCRVWGEVDGITEGFLSQIEATYTAHAWNNAVPTGGPAELHGALTIVGANVSVGPLTVENATPPPEPFELPEGATCNDEVSPSDSECPGIRGIIGRRVHDASGNCLHFFPSICSPTDEDYAEVQFPRCDCSSNPCRVVYQMSSGPGFCRTFSGDQDAGCPEPEYGDRRCT